MKFSSPLNELPSWFSFLLAYKIIIIITIIWVIDLFLNILLDSEYGNLEDFTESIFDQFIFNKNWENI